MGKGRMARQPRLRFWFEVMLAGAAFLAAMITLVWNDWIEAVFGIDPDHHSGSAEWMVVAGCLVLAVASSVLARREWGHPRVPVVAGEK